MTLLAGAVSVYSQGQIFINDYNPQFSIQVWGQQSVAASTVAVSFGGYTGYEEMGNSSNTYIWLIPEPLFILLE